MLLTATEIISTLIVGAGFVYWATKPRTIHGDISSADIVMTLLASKRREERCAK